MKRYTKEQIKIIYEELKNIDGRTSKQIGEKINIPDFTIRRYARNKNINFGHFTPFKSKDSVIISDILNEFITGSLLGDGYITKYLFNKQTSKNKNSMLSIKHSIKQKEYVLYKYSILTNEIKCKLTECEFYDDRIKFKNIYKYILLNTIQNKSFNEIRNIWYEEKKIIPKNIKITPLVLAIWFQDDGYKSQKGGYYLCTDNFSINDVELLQKILFDNFKIESNIHIRNKKHNRIYIKTKCINTFNKIVLPYMCKSMIYKLHCPL